MCDVSCPVRCHVCCALSWVLAGVGSVLTVSGQHELEASVMTDNGCCGAVALVKHIANPVKLAQQVCAGGCQVPPSMYESLAFTC